MSRGVPSGTGSRASHEASISVESSPKASIPNAEIYRLAEIIYHADGFTDHLETIAEPPVWVEAELATGHSGDCTKQPWSCLRCHAEEYVGIARYVAARWPASDSARQGESAAPQEDAQ